MAKRTKTAAVVVVGLDLGDRWIHICGLDAQGEEVESARISGRKGIIRVIRLTRSAGRILAKSLTNPVGAAGMVTP